MAATGYGIVETGNGAPGHRGGPGRLIECGVITFARQSSLPRRLPDLHAEIVALIDRHHPAALALENAFYHRNVRTTLVLGHARGVVLLAAQQAGLAIAEDAPATGKKTVTGAGAAPKAQVGAVVARLLRLRQAPRPADAADGVARAPAPPPRARPPGRPRERRPRRRAPRPA